MAYKSAINTNEILHLNRDPSANIVGVAFPSNRRKAASTLRNHGGGGLLNRAINAPQFVISESPEVSGKDESNISFKKRKEAAFIASNPYNAVNQSGKNSANTKSSVTNRRNA